eukprot:jgi/Psemu1/233929/estExt_Genewise1.C_90007
MAKLQISAEEEKAKFQKQLDDTPLALSSSTSSLSSLFDSNEVCSYLSSSEPVTATRLWEKYLPGILEASKNELMPPELQTDEEMEKLKKILTETLSPARMRRAVRHMPTFSHSIVKHVMDIIEKRFADPLNNPPLRIAVFGGSVTIGRDCTPKRMQYPDCAWPKRFELLLNQFFNADIVRVYNLAVGGTGTSVGTQRVKYWMYPDADLKKAGPDVIINSYSTNDSLPPWDKKWPEDDLIQITEERARSQLQDFIRASLQSKVCSVPPLVVHVDDYLGPQQPALLGELSYVSVMTQLAKYYDTVGISYAEVVRDIVYQDQTDTTFAGIGDVHYGYYAHQTIAWSVGFASLQLLVNYCDDEISSRTTTNENESNDAAAFTKEHIRNKKLFLPPQLTREFLLEDATTRFDAAVDDAHRFYTEQGCASAADGAAGDAVVDRNPCVVTWISTPGNFNAGAISRFMRQHESSNDGWQSERQNKEGWSNKDGWIATKPGASFALRFESLEKKLKTFTLYFLRSHGDKWKDSLARFTISRITKNPDDGSDNAPVVVSEHEISGVWDSSDYKYSITLFETFEFPEYVPEGETLAIEVKLVAGSTFKIMGMMLCSL